MTYQVVCCNHILFFIYNFTESQRKVMIIRGFIPNFSRHFSSRPLDNGPFYGQIEGDFPILVHQMAQAVEGIRKEVEAAGNEPVLL